MIDTAGLTARAVEHGATCAGVVELAQIAPAGGRLAAPPAVVVVITLAHPEDRPELDWWGVRGGTAGNRELIKISRGLVRWLQREHGVTARDLPYQVEQGGLLLKDAAALAGLGRIGDNNLLLTTAHGPRVRLRGLLMELELELEPSGPSRDDPCAGCDRPCQRACPQQAFASGAYSRERCAVQMALDESQRDAEGLVHYCRACELACPAGAFS